MTETTRTPDTAAPAIPAYVATVDAGESELSYYGTGATPAEALADFKNGALDSYVIDGRFDPGEEVLVEIYTAVHPSVLTDLPSDFAWVLHQKQDEARLPVCWGAFGTLQQLLGLVARDNGLTLKPPVQQAVSVPLWEVVGASAARLELYARKLSVAQLETLATGEEVEIDALVIAHNLQALHEFLNEAFDGEFRPAFFEA